MSGTSSDTERDATIRTRGHAYTFSHRPDIYPAIPCAARAMPLKDPAWFTDDELARELAVTEDEAVREYIARLLRDRAADADRPEIASLTDAEITALLPTVTDEADRDALVRVMWTRAARHEHAVHPGPETPR